jgi:hydroxyethylthiazole kinase-like uncharacterized protein yjeF
MFANVGDFDAHITHQFPHVVITNASTSRVTAWGVGPGFSGTDAESEFLIEILSGSLPVVLDAGALTALAQSAQLRALVEKRSALTVITPHVGEFRKLFPDLGEPTWSNVRHAAQSLNVIVVAKGPRTIMCAPNGRSFVDIEGTSALATAGSGDVLTGNIAGLLAAHSEQVRDSGTQKWDTTSLEIVVAGVWMHGRAGRIAAGFTHAPTALDIGDACGEVVPL